MSVAEPFKVGDKGVIYYSRGNPRQAWVIKVGRKWMTVQIDGSQQIEKCSMDTGRIDGGKYNSPGRFMRPAEVEAKERLRAAWDTINAVGLEHRLGRNPSDDLIVDLADWLNDREEQE